VLLTSPLHVLQSVQIQSLVASSTDNAYVCEQLQKIPAEDREALTLFFETLLANNFAYTLFGDKPVSCDNYLAVHGDSSRKCSYLNYGKKTWVQYNSLFPSSKFLFKYQRSGIFEDIFLINKAAFLQTVEHYLPLFQSVLGNDVTPEKLLNTLSQTNISYDEALHYHSGLIGLLYGFGYTNAFCYHKSEELEFEISKWFQPPIYFFKEDASLEVYKDPVFYFQKLAYHSNPKIAKQVPPELRALFEKRSFTFEDPCDEEDPLSLVNLSLFPLPAFGADCTNRIETKALLEKYRRTRHTIVSAYHQRDFLEVTLCKFIEK
jgi:hypothetical protein